MNSLQILAQSPVPPDQPRAPPPEPVWVTVARFDAHSICHPYQASGELARGVPWGPVAEADFA